MSSLRGFLTAFVAFQSVACVGKLDVGQVGSADGGTTGSDGSVAGPGADAGPAMEAGAPLVGSPEGGSSDGGSIAAGGPTIVATVTGNPSAIAIDSTSVYFVVEGCGPGVVEGGSAYCIEKAPIGGGGPVTTLVPPTQQIGFGGGDPFSLAVDTNNIYWTMYAEGVVRMMPIDGGMATVLSSAQTNTASIAVANGYVYWSANEGIFKVNVNDAGAPVNILPNSFGLTYDLALDETNVYFHSESGTVGSVPLDGGTPVIISTLADVVGGIAVDSTNVYWTNPDQGTVIQAPKVPVEGGAPITVLSGQEPLAIASDGVNVFWTTDQGGGPVLRVPVGDTTPIAVATSQDGPYGLAIDATNVYWTNSGSNTVMQAPK